MVVNKPPMGWNSWNTFGADINETLIKETADRMVEDGYLAAGYDTLVIDDAWQDYERSEDGHLVVDKTRFPSGMKALGDYVHSKGLKFGIYSAAGVRTCCNRPGSYGHEYVDAQDFADWGVDYLKYDLCHFPGNGNQKTAYLTMSMALKATGRDIVYSGAICGESNAGTWMRSIGAHQYRSTGDIHEIFSSIKFIADKAKSIAHLSASSCYNDMDMLVVGMDGKGYATAGGCDLDEYFTHFALWCFYNSPLMIGCDLRTISKESRELLLNKDLIAINQDIECRFPYIETESRYAKLRPDSISMMKMLSDNKFAFGFFNLSEEDANIHAYLSDFGVPYYAGRKLRVRNIQTGAIRDVVDDINVDLKKHQSAVMIAEFVD